MSETDLQRRIQIALSHGPVRLFRNNCGVLQDKDGRYIKYGVANPGGSDFIGWKSITITAEMVGAVIAQFVGLEVKLPKKYPTAEQRNFLAAVQKSGGIGAVARSIEDAENALRGSTAAFQNTISDETS